MRNIYVCDILMCENLLDVLYGNLFFDVYFSLCEIFMCQLLDATGRLLVLIIKQKNDRVFAEVQSMEDCLS